MLRPGKDYRPFTRRLSIENSASYVAIEAMIQQGWVIMSFPELERYLEMFEKKGLISPSERDALLNLAQSLNHDQERQH